MARIRTIKPELPQSESMGRVSRDARLCFILLWTLADDAGRLRGNSRMLASLLFPYDDDAKDLMSAWLGELIDEGCIIAYRIGADSYVQICKWLIHQKIDKPSQSKIPPHSDDSVIPREDSRILPVGSKDQGSKDQGSVAQKRSPSIKLSIDDLVTQGIQTDVAKSFIMMRKEKRAPVSQVVIDGIAKEAQNNNKTLSEALAICVTRGWQSYKADWDKDPQPGQQGRPYMTASQRRQAGTDEAIRQFLATDTDGQGALEHDA